MNMVLIRVTLSRGTFMKAVDNLLSINKGDKMPRQPTTDKEIVRTMTLEGKLQQPIADVFSCTRQRISQIQTDLRNEGKLPPKEEMPKGEKRLRETTSPKPDGQPTWEDVKAFVLTAIEQASRVSELEAELIRYKRGYDNALAQLKGYEKVEDEAKRYKIALNQGQINPPIGLPGKADLVADFTYHIDYQAQISISDKCLPDNITLEALLFSIEYNITEAILK